MNFVEQPHPNVAIALRRCSHCREVGHRILMCRRAFSDGRNLYNVINQIIQANLVNPENIEQAVYLFLNSLTVSKLKLLTIIHSDLNIFASNLYHNYLITLSQTGLRTKRDMVLVLNYYYKQIYAMRLPIFIQEPELFQMFQAPPLHRPYGSPNNQEFQPFEPRKFRIETEIKPIDNNDVPTFDCPICLENVENSKRITSNCNHDVCETCFITYLTSIQKFNFKNPSCCLCRTNVTSLTFTDNDCCNTIKTTFLN